MSIGQPCRHCLHGKMRPIHFSWDQAVVLCDNKKCKSLLDISPSECIIKRDLWHPSHQQVSSDFGLQCLLNDGSSRSSSGVYSEARSSLPSPAQSGKSVTDEEVEFLLKASYAPLSYKGTTVASSVSSEVLTHAQVSPKVQNPQSDSSGYDGFFELLGNLDLEPQLQPVNPQPQTESSSMETSFDVVTAELEGWMKDFDFTSACFDSSSSNDPSVGDQRPQDEAVKVASPVATTNMQGPFIPSQRSAFTPIDASTEYAACFDNEQNSSFNPFVCHSSLAVNNTTPNCVQQCENPGFSVLLESEFVSGNLSNFHTRFMSPTASAASEDSGYNEEDGKAIIGAAPLVNEENSKVSSETTFLFSSLKNQNSYSLSKLVMHTNKDNLKDLMQNNLEWPVMSGMHTLTVLPAIVTTEKSIVNTPQEPLGSPLTSQATGSNETCTAVQDIRERVDLGTEEQAETPQIPSGLCQDNEHETVSLGNHDNVLTNVTCTALQDEREQVDLSTEETMSLEHHENLLHEIHAGSPSESSRTSVTSPTPESTVSEGSSHSTSSEAKVVSENVDASKLCSSTSSTVPENESKNKRGRQATSRNLRIRKYSDSSTRKHAVSDYNDTFLDSKLSKVRGKRKSRGVEEIKERARRKGKSPRLRPEREKRGSLNKASFGKLTKRPGNVSKVHLKEQLPTSSGENYFLENTSEELLEGGDSVDLPGCQTPDEGTNHLSSRGRNLSPRKLLMGHVNKDPWSVVDLSLEELTIEIVVEGGQREASSHTDKAAKCNVQLQQVMSLFSQESESDMSNVPTKDTVQDASSEVSVRALLDKENGECLTQGDNLGFNNSEEKIVDRDGNQNLSRNSGQNLQTLENQSCTKNFSKESELDVSHVSTTYMVPDIPSKVSEGTVLENKSGEYPYEGKNSGINDSEEETAHGDSNQNMMGNSGQNLQTLENQLSLNKNSKDSESEASHVPTKDTVQEIPSKVSDGALLDEKSGECLFKGENSGINDSKEKTTHGDGNLRLIGNSGQNLENQASTKNLDLTNADETKLKHPTLDTFHGLPSGLDNSQLNVINESNCLKNLIQSMAQLVQRSGTDSALQLDINAIETIEHAPASEIGSYSLFSEEPASVENEKHAPNVDIGSSHLSSKEAGFIHQLDPSNFEQGVVTSPEDEKICSGSTEIIPNVKQCSDKQIVEADDHSVGLENCELIKEKFVSEATEYPSFSLNNVDVIEKATYSSLETCELNTEKFVSEEDGHPSLSHYTLGATERSVLETKKRQCISVSGSTLQTLRIGECESPWFDKDSDKNICDSETVVTEKFALHKPVTSTLDQSCDFDLDSNSLSSSTSREASPLHFLNPLKCETVRSWIGHEDSMSVEENKFSVEEKIIQDSDSSKPCPDLKSRLSSSMYFQSLVKDMDFDENFFQCPVREHPSKTFSEHLKSSLFFGETASNDYSPSHVELSEEALRDFKSCSKSNSLNMSLPQAYNHFAGNDPSAAYTQVPVPLPSSIAQPPSTSISINISPHTVSSILGKKMPRGKLLVIPKNSHVTYMVAASCGMNSTLAGSALLSPNLQSPLHSLLPEHSEMGSGGKGVGCKKPDVSKSGNHISDWGTETFPESAEEKPSCTDEVVGISSLAESFEVKPRYSHGFTGLSSEGVGREQGNHSSSEVSDPDKSCENSVALSHPPNLDTQDKESKLDEALKTKWESKLSPSNFTNMLSSSVTSKQISGCYCAGVGDNYKVCDSNTGIFEHEKDITMHCREQTNHKTDIFCASDADVDKLPTIYLDSDDEIHITVEGKAIDHHCFQAGKESVSSDENSMTEGYSVNDHINHYCYNDESIKTKLSENCITERNLVNDVHVNQCHKDGSVETKLNEIQDHRASHILIGSELKRKADDQGKAFKKQKLHDTLTDMQTKTHKHTGEKQPGPTCSAHCGALMCGILDNSVLHDESCHSASLKDFQDFAMQGVTKERQLQTVKTYTGSNKQCSATKCNENVVSSILTSCVAKESADDNDHSVCSSAKEIASVTVQDATVFSHNSEFGCLKASPQYDGYSYLRIENDVNDLNFFQVDSSYTEFLAPLISPTESLASTPEPEQEKSDSEDCIPQESGTPQEGRENENVDGETVKHKQSLLREEIKQNTSGPALAGNSDGSEAKNICIAPHTISQILSTNDISRNVNQFSVPCRDGKLLNRSVCKDSIRFTKFGENNDCNATQRTSTDAAGLQKLKRIIIFRKPSQSSLSVPQESHAFTKTSSATNLVPNSPFSAGSSPTVSTSGLSNASAKTITCQSQPRSQCVAGSAASHSRMVLPTSMSLQNMAPHPWAMASPSLASSNIAVIKFASSGIKKQEHQLDCQKPALPNTYTVVPPILASSGTNVSPRLACQPLVSACMRGSSIRHSPERVASPPVSLNHMKYDSKLTAQNDKNSDTQEEGASMLKKVKMGSKGSFYLRPTPALKNAMLEMRKKVTKESKIEEESSSGYMTLPDGTPISHPIFIPKRNEVQVVRHRRKIVKKKRDKRVRELVEEKVRESLESCNEEIPKMIVIYARKSFHICQIDVTENR